MAIRFRRRGGGDARGRSLPCRSSTALGSNLWLLAALLFYAGIGFPATASAATTPLLGSLAQLSGPYGCYSERGTEGCATGVGLRGAAAVAVSPDGRDVYVAANNSSSVATFRRGTRTGLLLARGCLSAGGLDGCRRARGLRGAFSIAISPDGRNLYVAALRGVATFARDPTTGELTQLAGLLGCVNQDGREGCARGPALANAAALEVSPDGRNVYVAAVVSNAVAVFARDQGTGAISQLAGADACVSQGGTEGCAPGRALGGAFSVDVSPDGRHAYVAALNSNAVAVLRRNPGDGALKQPGGTDACTSLGGTEGCAGGRGLEAPNDVAVSGDGRDVYVASSGSGAVVALARDPVGGNLLQAAGVLGCTSQQGTEGCSTGRALGGAFSIAMSPDDDNAYAVSSSAVIAFFRNRRTGSLTQFPDPEICTSQGGTENCGTGRALREPSAVALSPDGDNVYVASYRSNAVALFARNPQDLLLRIRVRGVPRRCVKRSFRARVAVASTLPLHRLRVYLDRRRLGTRRGTRRLTVRVRAGRLRRGRHRLRFDARDVAGNLRRRSVRFRRCGAERPQSAGSYRSSLVR